METVKALFSRKWIGPTIVVVLGMLLMIRLGIWQLDRLEQRRAANVELIAALDAQPINLNEETLDGDLEGLENRLVVVAGVYDLDEQIVLKVQNWQGRAGIHLITPLLIDGRDTAVIVDRGWLPQTDVDENKIGTYDVAQPVQIEGYLALSQIISRNAGQPLPSAPQTEMYRVDIEAIQNQLDYEIAPVYLVESPRNDGVDDLPLNPARNVEVSEGSHLSYALQWFSFTIMLAVIYFVLVRRSLKKAEQRVVDETD